MKYIFLLSILFVISGCTTYSEFQTKKPQFKGSTEKSPDDFIACATPKIMDVWRNTKVIPDGKKQVIVVGDSAHTTLTITAIPKSNGSNIIFRQMTSLRTFTKEWKLAKSCL